MTPQEKLKQALEELQANFTPKKALKLIDNVAGVDDSTFREEAYLKICHLTIDAWKKKRGPDAAAENDGTGQRVIKSFREMKRDHTPMSKYGNIHHNPALVGEMIDCVNEWAAVNGLKLWQVISLDTQYFVFNKVEEDEN